MLFKQTNLITTTIRERTNLIGKYELLKAFHLLETRGFYLYEYIICSRIERVIERTFTGAEERQVLFHTIFMTYKEDLGILKQITEQGTWFTRQELKNNLQKMSTCDKQQKFAPIKLTRHYKLASANQTGLISSSHQQVWSIPVFRGRRRQTSSENFLNRSGRKRESNSY